MQCLQAQELYHMGTGQATANPSDYPAAGQVGIRSSCCSVVLRRKLCHGFSSSGARMTTQDWLIGHNWSLNALKGQPAFPSIKLSAPAW